MRFLSGGLCLAAAALLTSCHPSPQTLPPSDTAGVRTVLGFLRAYGQRDLDGMMGHLAEDAVFLGSGPALSKPQIRAFFQTTFRNHPNLRVNVGSVKTLQGAIHVSVRVETSTVWADTWIFQMRHDKIRAYSLASGNRQVRPITSSG